MYHLLLMTLSLMKASNIRSALRLLRTVPMLVIIGNLKQSKLQSLFLLFRCLMPLFLHHNVCQVPWYLMMSLPALLSLPMMIQLSLLL